MDERDDCNCSERKKNAFQVVRLNIDEPVITVCKLSLKVSPSMVKRGSGEDFERKHFSNGKAHKWKDCSEEQSELCI